MNPNLRPVAIAFLVASIAACSGSPNEPVDESGDIGDPCHDGTCEDPGTGVLGPGDEGYACLQTDDCGYGLVCGPDGLCIEGGVAAEGRGCGSTEACQFGLVCTSSYVCGDAGPGTAGTPCDGAEDCAAGLECSGAGACTDPDDPTATGLGSPGDPCADTADCRMGLACFLDSTCHAPEMWTGADCSQSVTEENDGTYPFKIFFEVPDGSETDDFYRLPFPNNIRFRGGHIDLSGHPAPDTPLAEGIVASYLDAIENESTGFSTQGTVYFRFSKRIDFGTLVLSGADPNLYLVDITPDSPGYGEGGAIGMFATTSRGRYICQNWIGLKPTDGYPLRHATTYAVVVTDGIHSASAGALVRDGDFETMMSATEPTDPVPLAAWREYQPLRDYFEDATVADPADAAHVMAAAVFTTMDPDAMMETFRDKIRACTGSDCGLLPDPDPVGMTLSSDETLFYQVSGTVAVPVFQEGTPPYLSAGGGVVFDTSGVPRIQRSENVSFTLSVPKGTPPAGGWPVVLYAHGTGGASDSFVSEGIAEALADVEVTIDATPATVKFAVLSIDAVQHGSRRGGSDLSPEVLYFNFTNPEAAKYNAVQGAADNLQLELLVESLSATPVTVTGIPDPVRLDPLQVYYFGHSQGCLTGPLYLAYTPMVNAVVLSGAGGNLIQSLLTKKQPLDIAGLTRLVLGDVDVGDMHPMLNMLQLYFDPVDVVNYARDLTFAPPQIGETTDDPPLPIYSGPKHVFMSFGRDDHYSTEKTMVSLARPMSLQQVNDLGITCTCHAGCDTTGTDGLHAGECLVGGLSTTTTPTRANVWWGDTWFTAVMKMYVPDGYDGHFVVFDHPDGAADYSGFLASAVADPEGIPTLFP